MLQVAFTPTAAQTYTGSLTFTTNASVPTGSISLAGTGAIPPAITTPTPGSTLTAANVTFMWTPINAAYELTVGLKGPGSSDIYDSGVTSYTFAPVSGLQPKGAMIYVRLSYVFFGAYSWHYVDYTYTEGTTAAATMISPASGATLGFSGVNFIWTPGAFVTNYGLLLGTGGPGSGNLYNSGLASENSVTVPSLPADGAKVYARLFSEGSGGIQYVDYTYTESTGTSAALTSPTPGTTLGTSNVAFTWTAGTGVTKYDLLVGFGGPGSADLYSTGSTTALTATVPTLPANGAKIYVRLMSDISGTWHYTDYVYTAQ